MAYHGAPPAQTNLACVVGQRHQRPSRPRSMPLVEAQKLADPGPGRDVAAEEGGPPARCWRGHDVVILPPCEHRSPPSSDKPRPLVCSLHWLQRPKHFGLSGGAIAEYCMLLIAT